MIDDLASMAEDKDEDKEAGEEGAESGAEGEEGAEGGKKKRKGLSKKLKIIIVAVVLLGVIGGAGGFLYKSGKLDKFLHKGGGETAEGGEGGEEGAAVNADGVPQQSVYYDMEEFVVNLNVGSQRPSFLKMTVSLELGGELQIPRVEAKMPRIRDSFQVYLRELRTDDLQGSAGLYRLREELLLRINKIVYPAKVNDILFKEILVQ